MLVPRFAMHPGAERRARDLDGAVPVPGDARPHATCHAFLLAGYTTSLIGFPAVMVPGDVFTTAITRVQEIAIGILAATLVHALVLPRRSRCACTHGSLPCWMTRNDGHGTCAPAHRTRCWRRTARKWRPTCSSCMCCRSTCPSTAPTAWPRCRSRAPHDRMLDVLMLSSAVEDSIARLRSPQASAMDSPGWRELMQTGLAAQQAELDLAHADCRVLQAQLCTARLDWRMYPRLARHAQGAVLHRDHRLALRSALGAFVGILLSCVLWIVTGWSEPRRCPSSARRACCSARSKRLRRMSCAIWWDR